METQVQQEKPVFQREYHVFVIVSFNRVVLARGGHVLMHNGVIEND